MADFIGAIRGLPQLSNYSQDAVTMMVEDAVTHIAGAHKWPFLLEANRSLTWTANATTKQFDSISWISALRYPDASNVYRPLNLKTDEDFARFKYNNAGARDVMVWRNAAQVGSARTIELYAVPTSAAVLKADVYFIPTTGQIEDLPATFKRLVRIAVLAEVPNSGISIVNFDYALRESIAREEDNQGSVEYVGPDDFIEATMRYVNDPI